MKRKLKDFLEIMYTPRGGLAYANRFTTIVYLLVILVDAGLLLFNIIKYRNAGESVFDAIIGNSLSSNVVVLLILFMGGIVWAMNSKLDERVHTILILAVMFSVLQIVTISIGTFAVASNYIVIFLTIIYARPLLTFGTGIAVYVISIINYWTYSWVSNHIEEFDSSSMFYSSNESQEYFLDSILFYTPMFLVVAIMMSACVRKLFRYIREYSNQQAIVESNNNAASLIQHQILETTHVDETAKDNVSFYPFLETADYVAGDFYDYYSIDRYHICFLIADVSGKGMAAGLFMVRAKEVLKVVVKDHNEPANVVKRANEVLCENNAECMFASAWVGILDLRTGELKYSNAGHTAPVLICNNKVITLNEVSGPMLGLFPDKEYSSHSVQIGEGDRILLYTDGVTEQPINDKERYDEKGLVSFVKKNLDKDNLCDAIYEDINSYEQKQFDDITMLQVNLNKLKMSTSKIGKVIRRNMYLAASPKSIREFRKVITEELTDTNVSKDDINTFYVACEEMLTNIIKYAYGSADNNGGIVVDFNAEDDFLFVVIKDSGVEFNPFLYDNSVYANDENVFTEGGRGIKIFTEIMDEYSYERVNDTNVLIARKYV